MGREWEGGEGRELFRIVKNENLATLEYGRTSRKCIANKTITFPREYILCSRMKGRQGDRGSLCIQPNCW